MNNTLAILEAREAAGTIDPNGRAVLAILRRRAASGFVQPTGEQIMARAAGRQAICPACGQPQSSESCDRREHW